MLELTLAAVSSSGVFASEGSSADCAGWKAVLITATVRGQDVDDADGRVGVDADGHRRQPDRAQQVGGEHHRHARVTVAEHRGERRDERGRQPADQRDQADRRGAAVVVRVDDECDAEAQVPMIEPAQASWS